MCIHLIQCWHISTYIADSCRQMCCHSQGQCRYYRGDHPHTVLLKYADGAALVGLVTGGEEVHYHNNIARLVSKCDEDGLELNLAK